MLVPRVIPTLLMRGKGLVKGVRFKDHQYIGDPINAVKIFNDKRADELIFLDITATCENRIPDEQHIMQISDEAYMPFAVGGGLRSVQDIRRMLLAGAEKVCLNTAAVEDPTLVSEASQVFGAQSIVASIDVKKKFLGGYEVVTRSGAKKTGLNPVEHAKKMQTLGAGELMITSIDCEGTMGGYDLGLVRLIVDAVDIPVIASGGAGSIKHISQAIRAGAHSASCGSMFVFHGPRKAVLINYPQKTELKQHIYSGYK